MTATAVLMTGETVVMELEVPSSWPASGEIIRFDTPETPIALWGDIDAIDVHRDGVRVGRFQTNPTWLRAGDSLTFDPAGFEMIQP